MSPFFSMLLKSQVDSLWQRFFPVPIEIFTRKYFVGVRRALPYCPQVDEIRFLENLQKDKKKRRKLVTNRTQSGNDRRRTELLVSYRRFHRPLEHQYRTRSELKAIAH